MPSEVHKMLHFQLVLFAIMNRIIFTDFFKAEIQQSTLSQATCKLLILCTIIQSHPHFISWLTLMAGQTFSAKDRTYLINYDVEMCKFAD